MINVCFSGGAIGADTEWGLAALSANHDVIHFSFGKHKSQDPANTYVLDEHDLAIADPFLRTASKTLGRNYPPRDSFVKNLLQRNYFQIRDSERLYAVATIKNGLVQGGTGWAVQMFLDRRFGDCFVYDQRVKKWFQWKSGWVETIPYKPHGMWTGIGTRDINQSGKAAIKEILEV